MGQDFYGSHDAGPEWGTPREIWQPLADALRATRLDQGLAEAPYWGFDLDPASGCEPLPIARTRYTVEDDGLERSWFGHVWVNPPYGREHNDPWAEKMAREAARDEVESVTALVSAATSTKRFHRYMATADLWTFVKGRVEFIGTKPGKASFASVLCTWGVFPQEYLAALQEIGTVVKVVP